jgi:hypothetical protein
MRFLEKPSYKIAFKETVVGPIPTGRTLKIIDRYDIGSKIHDRRRLMYNLENKKGRVCPDWLFESLVW